MTDIGGHEYSKLPDLINDLKPHDHLCLIYESQEEWLATVVPFISSGLKRGEKCIYVVDANTARQIKAVFMDAGMAVDDYESKGQLSIIHERDTYTRGGFFDPDLMIALLIDETKKALREGYPALRVTGEMSWALRDYSGVERVLEYEAKLNKDLFPAYPCVAICQYDRWKFDPETIKGVVLTHPLLIRSGQIYRNFYYVEPEEYLNHKKSEREVQHWLNNLERERKVQESLQKSEEKHRRLFETMAQGVVYQDTDGKIISANPAAERILGLTFDQMQGKTSMDPRWQMIEEDGTPVPGEEHSAMIALRTGQVVDPVIRGVYRPDKNSHVWLRITATPVFQPGVTDPFQSYAVFEDITEIIKSEEALRESEQRAKRQRAAIADLFLEETITSGEIVPAIKIITEVLSSSVKVERVSIWVIDEKSEQLQCLDLYESSTGKHSNGDILHIKTFPRYFEAILEDSRISVANAQEDPRSRELNEGYFKLFGIASLLDAGIVVDGKLKGVVSFEHVGEQRRVWHADEEAFASTIASMVGQLFIGIERNKAEAEIHTLNAELEQRVRERTTELEAVNKELAAFAYSISHDFRAPLRALNAFSANLTDKYNDQLDEQGLHYLNRINKASLYMSDLVDDLLKLSRITRTTVKEQVVDISQIAEEILKELQEAEPESQVKVAVEPGLSATGDIALLKAALENLIGNAWKFSSKEPQAEIKVGRMTIDGEEAFFVRDNGVGFNMAYADKLFGAFQRLHGVDEFPGTGIGLATVQRIVNRHGGRIWAESEVGKGATFYFTLPK